MDMKFLRKSMASLLILLPLLGCQSSNIKSYPNSYSKNLDAYLTPHSDPDIKARIDIFELDKGCQDHYQGTIYLERTPTKIGIPSNRRMELSFLFLHSDWIKGRSSTAVNAVITARSGYRYEAVLNYVDSSYEIDVFEIKKSGSKRKKLNLDKMNTCH